MAGGIRSGIARAALARAWLVSILLLTFAGSGRAETTNVKIMLDWIIQGTHAPFFVAQSKGYFKAAGVTVDALDPGKGATLVAPLPGSSASTVTPAALKYPLLWATKNGACVP